MPRAWCNRAIPFNTYTCVGALLAADLVNGAAGDRDELAGLLDRYELDHGPVADADAVELTAWNSLLRGVFFEKRPPQRAALIDALLVASDCRPRLVEHDGLAFHLHYVSPTQQACDRLKAVTAAGLAQIVSDGGIERIDSCAAAACDRVFVDVSRRGGRCYCSVQCATRTNVARHRERRRGGVPSSGAGAVPPLRTREP